MTNDAPARTKLTPPQMARSWGIDVAKILGWIRSGELKACNAATHPGGRPRWLIDVREIEAFEARRSSQPTPRKPRRTRRADFIPFFK